MRIAKTTWPPRWLFTSSARQRRRFADTIRDPRRARRGEVHLATAQIICLPKPQQSELMDMKESLTKEPDGALPCRPSLLSPFSSLRAHVTSVRQDHGAIARNALGGQVDDPELLDLAYRNRQSSLSLSIQTWTVEFSFVPSVTTCLSGKWPSAVFLPPSPARSDL